MTAGQGRSRIEEVMLASMLPSSHTYPRTLHRLWISSGRLAVGSIALALVTVCSYKFHLNAATVVWLYLFIVVLQSLAGGAMISAMLTAAVGACLAHCFFPPIFSFRIYDSLNCLALFTFLAMAHVVTRLISNARKTLRDNKKRVAPAQTAAHVGERDRERRSTAIKNQMVTPRDTGRQENSMRGLPIPDSVVYRQVARITVSRAFRRCIRLRRLLEFIVDVTVKGERNSLKEWVIGTDVYNRGKDFDPRLDPIVRTEIRRLRRKLDEYFETEGREDAVVIEVPKGSYIPSFRDRRDEDFFKLPGETIDDYFVLDRFDESFDTVTYRVRENTSEQVFALKVISVAALASPEVRQVLEADTVPAAALQHENICRVHRSEHSGQNIYIITECFEGQETEDSVDRNPPSPRGFGWAARLMVRMSAAILAAAIR